MSNKRQPSESFDAYKLRIKEDGKKEAAALKGKIVLSGTGLNRDLIRSIPLDHDLVLAKVSELSGDLPLNALRLSYLHESAYGRQKIIDGCLETIKNVDTVEIQTTP